MVTPTATFRTKYGKYTSQDVACPAYALPLPIGLMCTVANGRVIECTTGRPIRNMYLVEKLHVLEGTTGILTVDHANYNSPVPQPLLYTEYIVRQYDLSCKFTYKVYDMVTDATLWLPYTERLENLQSLVDRHQYIETQPYMTALPMGMYDVMSSEFYVALHSWYLAGYMRFLICNPHSTFQFIENSFVSGGMLLCSISV